MNIVYLPIETLEYISYWLNNHQLANYTTSCKLLYSIYANDNMWGRRLEFQGGLTKKYYRSTWKTTYQNNYRWGYAKHINKKITNLPCIRVSRFPDKRYHLMIVDRQGQAILVNSVPGGNNQNISIPEELVIDAMGQNDVVVFFTDQGTIFMLTRYITNDDMPIRIHRYEKTSLGLKKIVAIRSSYTAADENDDSDRHTLEVVVDLLTNDGKWVTITWDVESPPWKIQIFPNPILSISGTCCQDIVLITAAKEILSYPDNTVTNFIMTGKPIKIYIQSLDANDGNSIIIGGKYKSNYKFVSGVHVLTDEGKLYVYSVPDTVASIIPRSGTCVGQNIKDIYLTDKEAKHDKFFTNLLVLTNKDDLYGYDLYNNTYRPMATDVLSLGYCSYISRTDT